MSGKKSRNYKKNNLKDKYVNKDDEILLERDSRSQFNKIVGERVRIKGKISKGWKVPKSNSGVIAVPIENVVINDSPNLNTDHIWIKLNKNQDIEEFLKRNIKQEITFTAVASKYKRTGDKTKSIGFYNIRQMTNVKTYRRLKEAERKLTKKEKERVLLKNDILKELPKESEWR